MYARRLFAGALLLSQSACMTIRTVTPPVKYIESNSPSEVWITTRSGTESLVYRPRILSDSIFGFDQAGQQLTMPVDVVQGARVKTMDTGKTMLVAGGFLAVTGVAVGLLVKGASSKATPCVNTATIDCRYVTSNRGVGVSGSIPVSTTTRVVSGIARALFGSK